MNRFITTSLLAFGLICNRKPWRRPAAGADATGNTSCAAPGCGAGRESFSISGGISISLRTDWDGANRSNVRAVFRFAHSAECSMFQPDTLPRFFSANLDSNRLERTPPADSQMHARVWHGASSTNGQDAVLLFEAGMERSGTRKGSPSHFVWRVGMGASAFSAWRGGAVSRPLP